ncbi:MAG: rhamnan synthesis F family protein [Ilumatobacteraceae bacterium]
MWPPVWYLADFVARSGGPTPPDPVAPPASRRDNVREALDDVYASATWRTGRFVLGSVSWIGRLLRGRRSPAPVRLRVHQLWPAVRGTASSRAKHSTTTEVSLMIGSVEAARISVEVPRRARAAFEIPYPIMPFPIDLSRVRVAGRPDPTARRRGLDRDLQRLTRVVTPAEIADASIRSVIGDETGLRTSVGAGAPVALVSTFRPPGRSPAHLVHLLTELRTCGFRVVVVDTSDEAFFDPELTDLTVHRHNSGWDFASWVTTLRHVPWLMTEPTRILLVNDSCYGPVRPLHRLFEMGDALGVDAWGLTDSWDIDHHIQSYFLVLDRRVISHGALARFVDGYTFPAAKGDIIHEAEVAFTRTLRADGLTVAAVFDVERVMHEHLAGLSSRLDELAALPENRHRTDLGRSADSYELVHALLVADAVRRMEAVNPTHLLWDTLIDLGFPFVKRELVMKNPLGVPFHRTLRSKLANDAVFEMVRADLRSLGQHHSGA